MGLEALKYYLEKRDKKFPPTETVVRLAELVLKKNCMEFAGEYFEQISGTMMGTPCAVEYSCLAMSYLEEQINQQYTEEKPLLFVRYIDDIFGISCMDMEKLVKFIDFVQGYHPAISYTIEIGSEHARYHIIYKREQY